MSERPSAEKDVAYPQACGLCLANVSHYPCVFGAVIPPGVCQHDGGRLCPRGTPDCDCPIPPGSGEVS